MKKRKSTNQTFDAKVVKYQTEYSSLSKMIRET